MLSFANTCMGLSIVIAFYLNHHVNLIMQVTHMWITRSKIFGHDKTENLFFYSCSLNEKTGSQEGIQRIKNSQDSKSYLVPHTLDQKLDKFLLSARRSL